MTTIGRTGTLESYLPEMENYLEHKCTKNISGKEKLKEKKSQIIKSKNKKVMRNSDRNPKI